MNCGTTRLAASVRNRMFTCAYFSLSAVVHWFLCHLHLFLTTLSRLPLFPQLCVLLPAGSGTVTFGVAPLQ